MARSRQAIGNDEGTPSSGGSLGDAPWPSVPFGAWYDEADLSLSFPAGWQAYLAAPDDAVSLSDEQIEDAIAQPIGTAPLAQLAAGKKSVVIAVDDLTRPTPVHRFLPQVIRELGKGGVPPDHIRIVMGTAAHRPMRHEEIVKKLGPDIVARHEVVMHDFMGPDVRYVGWVDGGPVYLNRHLLEADLRICVGGVIPHGEVGFGGGAKIVVPGLAGRATIAHFHGALPGRGAGCIEAASGILDRRSWAERVARHVGVEVAVCAVINSRRELAGLHVGDVVEAHRSAARQAGQIGRTVIPQSVVDKADVVVVNAYPLDTDPIQMGKSLALARKLSAKLTVIINAASDGVFFHGMGMGSGVSYKRLLSNLPSLMIDPVRQWTWMRSMSCALGSPMLSLRTCYFTLNHLSYSRFEQLIERQGGHDIQECHAPNANPLVFSKAFPVWGFRRKYSRGQLYRDWDELSIELGRRFPKGRALILPCAPLQSLEIDRSMT